MNDIETPIEDQIEIINKDAPVDEQVIRRHLPYRGHGITITNNFRFQVTGPEFEYKRETPVLTVEEAKKMIDKAVELKAKAKALKFSKIVLNDAGDLITVLGFNRTDGDLKVAGEANTGRYVYPNVPWIAAALKNLANHRQEMDEIITKLHDLRVSATGRTYRGLSADEYATRLMSFDAEVDRAETVALENA